MLRHPLNVLVIEVTKLGARKAVKLLARHVSINIWGLGTVRTVGRTQIRWIVRALAPLAIIEWTVAWAVFANEGRIPIITVEIIARTA
ncbi:hypothetical protein GCM10009861_23500 [Neomicrococcus aestuarii]